MFQKGLSSPASALNFLSPANTVIQEFIKRIGESKSKSSTDFLPELSRLFLECALFLFRSNP